MSSLHKDFHGCLSICLQFLHDQFGVKEVQEYLRKVARNVYKPLIDSLRANGLQTLENHWRNVLEREEALFQLRYEDGMLILIVQECPAVHHIRQRGYALYDGFCETTRVINDEICNQAGYCFSIEYDQSSGTCTQRFSKRD